MRAVEVTILLIMILTAPSVIGAMGVIPVTQTCGAVDCQASQTIYSMASSFELKAVDLSESPGQIAWDVLTLTVTFPIYAFFWMLYFLSTIVLIRPALITMFHVPDIMATYLNVGVWILWLVAYVQWKRGGIGIDGYR
jgi:hypothetical protein